MSITTPKRAALVLATAWLSTSLAAQPQRPPQPADPTQAQADTPALAYRSALQTYRPWREQAPGNWRALNDEVTRIGGWRSYLREVNEPAATPAALPAATPALALPATPTGAGAGAPTAPASAAPGSPAAAPPRAPSGQTPAPKGHHHGHH